MLDRVMERGREILDSPIYDLSDEDDTGGDDEAAANEDGFEIDSFRVDGKKVHFSGMKAPWSPVLLFPSSTI